MKKSDLNQFFVQNTQFDRDIWYPLAKPCFDMVFVEKDLNKNSSFFAGAPYLPHDFVLPETPQGIEYRFIAQINFADLPSDNPLRSQFPEKGILSLFYQQYAKDWELGNEEPFFGAEHYIRAFYFTEDEERVLHDDKMSMIYHEGKVIPAKTVAFEYGLNMPCSDELWLPDFPVSKKMLDEFLEQFQEYAHDKQVPDYLAGYPSFYSLGYNPTPETVDERWLPLFTLESHNDLAWCWQDGNKLMAFIEQSALAKCDFAHIKSDAG